MGGWEGEVIVVEQLGKSGKLAGKFSCSKRIDRMTLYKDLWNQLEEHQPHFKMNDIQKLAFLKEVKRESLMKNKKIQPRERSGVSDGEPFHFRFLHGIPSSGKTPNCLTQTSLLRRKKLIIFLQLL